LASTAEILFPIIVISMELGRFYPVDSWPKDPVAGGDKGNNEISRRTTWVHFVNNIQSGRCGCWEISPVSQYSHHFFSLDKCWLYCVMKAITRVLGV
jgi:hypothetical protein